MDGGNSFFLDTERRNKALEAEGFNFIGTGVSGGEEGALWGPAIMPGGQREAWEATAPIFRAIAAKAEDGQPCVEYMGPRGAGHYVKMVHNGIEYGDMQLIAEIYDLLHRGAGVSNGELARIFSEWNEGELKSYLIEITANILRRMDEETGEALVDFILDEAAQKGTGKWTSPKRARCGRTHPDHQCRGGKPHPLQPENRAGGCQPHPQWTDITIHRRCDRLIESGAKGPVCQQDHLLCPGVWTCSNWRRRNTNTT